MQRLGMIHSLYGFVCLFLCVVVSAAPALNQAPSHHLAVIEGRLLMLDDETPHVAVSVQTVRISESVNRLRGESANQRIMFHVSRFTHEVIATTLSDERGEYRFINLKPGRYQVRCYAPEGYVYYGVKGQEGKKARGQEGKNHVSLPPLKKGAGGFTFHATGNSQYGDILNVELNKTISNIDFRFAPFKKGTWKTYNSFDGLASNFVRTICRAPDGMIWFGTDDGVSRYDGKTFVTFTQKDGLANNRIFAIHCASDGAIWFGTEGGVSRYAPPHSPLTTTLLPPFIKGDGGSKGGFVTFTQKNGLADNHVQAIHGAPGGVIWFGTKGGVSRYDGKQFVTFTQKDGLASNNVRTIFCDPSGVMWFGTKGGVSRYDGKGFITFTQKDELIDNDVNVIYGAPSGVMWFGTRDGGVSRYEGSPHFEGGVRRGKFVTFTQKDGLADNRVRAIYSAPDGVIWFGTEGGVSRYNVGRNVISTYTTKDGLADNRVRAIYKTPDGVMWFGTESGGVSLYDGIAWASLDTRDGLAGNSVRTIYQDSDGILWFGTDKGITRYCRSATKPSIHIVSVRADRFDTKSAAISPITAGTRVTIEYSAIDFKTVPEKRQYRYRIYESANHATRNTEIPYNPPTKETSFDWTPKRPGIYTFEAQAINQNLNYSEPASVTFTVVPPWYHNVWIVFPLRTAFLAILISSIFFGTRYYAKRREAQRLREQMLASERSAREKAERNVNLLRSIAHAVKNPLRIIEAYSEHLTFLGGTEPDWVNKSLQKIKEQVNQASQTVNRLLEATALPEFRVFDLKLEIELLLHQTLPKKPAWEQKIQFCKQCNPIPQINGDADKLRIAFENLLTRFGGPLPWNTTAPAGN